MKAHAGDVTRLVPRGREALKLLEQVARTGEQILPVGSEADGSSAPGEQDTVQPLLEDADLPAERRLGHVQALSRGAEVELLGDHQECLEQTRLDAVGPFHDGNRTT